MDCESVKVVWKHLAFLFGMETFGGAWTKDREEFSSHWVAAAFCASLWLLPSFRDAMENCTILWHSIHARIYFKE